MLLVLFLIFLNSHFSYVRHHFQAYHSSLKRKNIVRWRQSRWSICEKFRNIWTCLTSAILKNVQNSVFLVFKMMFQSYEFFGSRNRYYFIPRSLHLWFRLLLNFLKIFNFVSVHKTITRQNYFRKNVAIFWAANNYLDKDYKTYLSAQKWLWTDLFLRVYF